MAGFNFEVLKTAWNTVKKKRLPDLQRVAPYLTDPGEIYIKRIKEDEDYLTVQFLGFENSVSDTNSIPQVKRLVLNWVKEFSVDVSTMRGDATTLIVRIAKELKFTEAAISIFKRDPKTNKSKRYYKCIGGKKHGRRVANPKDCIGFPDFAKKMKFAMTKRQKAGQAGKAKKKTQLTNIMAKRIRKANMRLKKARGF